MKSFTIDPRDYEWEVVEERGEFRGVELTYEGDVDRNRVFRAFVNVMRKYQLKPEIRNMVGYVSGASIRLRDTSLQQFEKRHGYDNTRVKYLDIMGRRSSLKAKLLGRVPPYVQLRAGYAKMVEISISDIDGPTSLEILDDLSEQIGLGIPTGLIGSDIDFLKG